jgi:TetR/AcrR family transcriptional regulator, regulator of cefoperazone and chloramphenicol sensitivity
MALVHQVAHLVPDPVVTSVSDRTRARLLDVATQIFADVGYYAATIRDIAHLAGTNVAAVNYHFGDKLGLYTEILERRLVPAARTAPVRQALELDAPPETVLRQAIKAMAHTVCAEQDRDLRMRLLMHELAHPSPAIDSVINKVSRPLYDRFRKVIGRMIGLPIDHEKTRLCTHSVIGQIVHYAHARPFVARLWPEQKMTPKQLDRIADHIADFSLAYLRRSGAGHSKAAPGRHTRSKK